MGRPKKDVALKIGDILKEQTDVETYLDSKEVEKKEEKKQNKNDDPMMDHPKFAKFK